MLVYRGMDIGTAKPSATERGDVPYFGMDLVTPAETFSTGLWLISAREALAHAAHSHTGEAPGTSGLIIAGGTGLYIKALTDGLDGAAADPEARVRWQALFEREGIEALRRELAARDPDAWSTLSDPSNPRRLIRALEHLESRGGLPKQWKRDAPDAPVTILRLPREQLHARIEHRVARMLRQGLVEEVRTLRQLYPVWSVTARQAIGYAEVCALLDGSLTLREATERIVIRTRQLAKRQETWFRHQTQTVWLDIDANDPPARIALRVLDTWRQHGPTPVVSP